jgi:hypothetical protein
MWMVDSLRWYALKLNFTFHDIQRQLVEDLEVIKQALDIGFKCLDHPFALEHVCKSINLQVCPLCKSLNFISFKLVVFVSSINT